MFVPVVLLAFLIVLIGCSAGEAWLEQFGEISDPDPVQTLELEDTTASIDPDLLEALGRESEVDVLVSLKPPDMPLSEQTTVIRRRNAAERQERVLSVLTDSDFALTHRYELASAMTGRITASGVEKLATHPDVAGIGMDRSGKARLGTLREVAPDSQQ